MNAINNSIRELAYGLYSPDRINKPSEEAVIQIDAEIKNRDNVTITKADTVTLHKGREKADTQYDPSRLINEDYIKQIQEKGKEVTGKSPDIDDTSWGMITKIAENDTENKNKPVFKIFTTDPSNIKNLTVGQIADYFYNTAVTASAMKYMNNKMSEGMNTGSAAYNADKELFDAVVNDSTGLAKYAAELYFRYSAPKNISADSFSNNLQKFIDVKLSELDASSLQELMIAKDSGDIEAFNYAVNNLYIKDNSDKNIMDTLKTSYKNMREYISDRPDKKEQQNLIKLIAEENAFSFFNMKGV